MNPTEWATYVDTNPQKPDPEVVSVEEVGDTDRTLAYGFTAKRDSWHAYVHDGELHVIEYSYGGEVSFHASSTSLPLIDLRPNKAVYPDACELEFAQLMRLRGEPLPLGRAGVPADGYTPRELTADGYLARTHLDLF